MQKKTYSVVSQIGRDKALDPGAMSRPYQLDFRDLRFTLFLSAYRLIVLSSTKLNWWLLEKNPHASSTDPVCDDIIMWIKHFPIANKHLVLVHSSRSLDS